ncbi:hypothetical protein Pcinc_042190, partial [Petrolisthes cinctipes]
TVGKRSGEETDKEEERRGAGRRVEERDMEGNEESGSEMEWMSSGEVEMRGRSCRVGGVVVECGKGGVRMRMRKRMKWSEEMVE